MNSAILKDINFKENNILISLELLKAKIIDDIKHFYFKIIITYENSCFEKEIVLFADDIQNLSIHNFTNDCPDHFFNEPDLWLTIIQLNNNDLILYINFDSGLNHMNIATESGLSVRMNVTKESFNTFANNLKYFV